MCKKMHVYIADVRATMKFVITRKDNKAINGSSTVKESQSRLSQIYLVNRETMNDQS